MKTYSNKRNPCVSAVRPCFAADRSPERSSAPAPAFFRADCVGGLAGATVRVIGMLGLMAVVAMAGLEIKATAGNAFIKEHNDAIPIKIELRNTGSTPIGPLELQIRTIGYSEYAEDGEASGDLVPMDLAPVKQPAIPPGGKVTVEAAGPAGPFAGEDTEPRVNRKIAKGMVQTLRVRAWAQGRLVGEYSSKAVPQGKEDWPLEPPSVPEGVEAGSGPWLLLTKDNADFSGVSMGATAADVAKVLKSVGTGKLEAKPEPLYGHPLRMSISDLPGIRFGFDAGKRLSAVVVADSGSVKLPGGLVLGRSKAEDFDAVFGAGSTPDPLPEGCLTARRFVMGKRTLTHLTQPEGKPPLLILEASTR